MRGAHTREHEARLERVSSGELDPAEAGVQRLAQECAECRAALAEIARVRAALEARARADRDLLEEARRSAGPRDREQVARALERLQREPGADADARKRPRWRWWPLGLAAAAAAVLLLRTAALDDDGDGARRAAVFLGADEIDDAWLRPRGEVAEFDTFQWTWEAGPGESFELTIWPGGDLQAEPFVERGLKVSEWSPEPSTRADFGDAIRFRVSRFDRDGQLLGRAPGAAWLPSASR